MIVAVLADTHLLPGASLPTALLRGIAGADLILHAGDIACLEVLERLAAVSPLHAVGGNADPPGLRLPPARALRLGPWLVGLTHGSTGPGRDSEERARRACPGADVVVFGHSHRPLVARRVGGPLVCNPGSPTRPRGLPPTFALLDLGGRRPEARLVRLAEVGAGGLRG